MFPEMLPPLLFFCVHIPPHCCAFQCSFLPEALVDLMSVVVKLCPSVCESSHFSVLLGAYGATLSVLGKGVRSGWYGQRVCGDRAI